MIYVGLDFGEKRIGIAISDELGRFAEAHDRVQYRSEADLWQKLIPLVLELNPKEIVVGLPIRTTGELKIEAERAAKFAQKLKEKVACPVITWDERFTTKEADRIMRDLEFSESKRKEKRDAVAAQVLLQSYLDFVRLKGV